MKVAVIGATGLVGSVMIKLLEERKLPVTELIPVATKKSVGKKISLNGKEYPVIENAVAVERKPDIALFSAGGETSKYWAPKYAEAGAYVIDNSSAWRMDPDKKLIVPEINATLLSKEDKIIANPNCSTIQLVLPLSALHKKYNIQRIVISTYQSVTGSGANAVKQLEGERKNQEHVPVYPHRIDMNVIPHCDSFSDWGYTREEWKLINETKKILADNTLKITATTVRVPVMGGHSESVNVEFSKEFFLSELVDTIHNTPGVVVEDSPTVNIYPTPLEAEGKDEVFVGRIRRDFSRKNSINLWIVSDNLRKGAATNAIQIAEYVSKNFI